MASMTFPSILDDVYRELHKPRPDEHSPYLANLVRSLSKKPQQKAFRTLDDFQPLELLPYSDRVPLCIHELILGDCAFGQIKLVYAMLQFICETIKKIDCGQIEMLIVYVGASSKAYVYPTQIPQLRQSRLPIQLPCSPSAIPSR
jgi:hypothetical protein